MSKRGKIKIVILAAGLGKRMRSDLPKVLAQVKGKPMIRHLLESVKKKFKEKPIIIIGHKAELVQKEFGDSCFYVLQKEQLGTGHALACAEEISKDAEHIAVLSGDQPLITAKSIEKIIAKHLSSGAKITFAVTQVPDFQDWRKIFLSFGRILRKNGKVAGIKEYKDANENERNIKEVNAGCYVFDAKWLWKNLRKLKNDNAQKEYYLTDLIKIAVDEKVKIESVEISAREALGANSKEELDILESFIV